MRVRALSSTGDWMFGHSQSDYISGNACIEQDIQTALSSFLGNCFFDATSGIDWYNLLGGKNEAALVLAINAAILNVAGVTGLLQTSLAWDKNRNFKVTYAVTTVYSKLTSFYEYNYSV